MRRAFVAVACLSMLLVGATAAQAAEPGDDPVPPAFAPPTPGPVTDTDSAGAFAKLYVARNASRFLRTDRRRVRVIDADAACLQSPILASRFGCVFTLRALVIQRRHNWRNWEHAGASSKRGHERRRVRIRNFGCLGFLRINGGPSVTPSAQLVNVECGRVPRRDLVAPEPV